MTTARKILVSGDVCGKFNTLFERVRNILKKNKDFEMLLCVGSFFGSSEESKKEWEGYLAGNNSVPIPTFLLGPTEMHEVSYYSSVSLENGGELCENVTYLGRKGILKTKSGLQIAYLSGLEKSEAPEEGCHFVADDVMSLESLCQDESFKGLDILISSSWPKGVSNFANQPERVDPEKNGSALVSRLAQQLRPRYHFTGHEGYMYAFNIVPLVSMDKNELVKQPPDVTECPYNRLSGSNVNTADQNTNLQSQASATGQNFFFDMSNTGKSQGPGQKRRRDHGGEEGGSNKQPRQRKGPPPLKGSCWFCLGSPEVEKHLVVSVGDASYVALAKGGLVADHVLICPIAHFESTVKLTEVGKTF
ncbi:hypothetical protein pdam_00015893 [Pocillopora damicornis]|uniref:Cwf19-like C-terminal domain-containing protein n=1 Tax=Pocillopora damicornis TaxID=46731 RepID=A0A3M6UWD1_POCDA|nr:hypothetical protein pdam_00015893 [Pocillopora damicornis]